MEPVSVAVICVVVFGTVIALSAFIRQIMLSRNKDMNDKAQLRALSAESDELAKIRAEIEKYKRFDAHYQVLGNNKEAIEYLDNKVDSLLKKKQSLIERYAEITIKESKSIIDEGANADRKLIVDKLRSELDSELAFYDKELELLQKRRGSLWDSHGELQTYLLEQEKTRNEHLDNLYIHHSALLEKIYIRHTDNSEHIAVEDIQSSDYLFKVLAAPFQYLMQLFSLSSNINLDKWFEEQRKRTNVDNAQTDTNTQPAPTPAPDPVPAPSPLNAFMPTD